MALTVQGEPDVVAAQAMCPVMNGHPILLLTAAMVRQGQAAARVARVADSMPHLIVVVIRILTAVQAAAVAQAAVGASGAVPDTAAVRQSRYLLHGQAQAVLRPYRLCRTIRLSVIRAARAATVVTAE